MNAAQLQTLEQIRGFLAGTQAVEFRVATDEASRHRFVAQTLRRFGYVRLCRKDKGLLRRYLGRCTGYSPAQLTRLLQRAVAEGGLASRRRRPQAGFAVTYTPEDVALLAEMDRLHGGLSGPATRALCERALRDYGDERYVRLARISVAHLYRLRRSPGYRTLRVHKTATRPSSIKIGVRKAPCPEGAPGFIRIDSVHQGDWDGAKGVYHINAVDCVTQWQLVATCERIDEQHLLPVLTRLIEGFPFCVIGIHADNGSEYINHAVARLLMRMKINLTRSRPRRSNDNALVESKNGAVIRKHLGHAHIPQSAAQAVDAFCSEHLNPYLNFHRPCFFAQDHTDAKGKTRKRYPQNQIMTPCDRLLALPDDVLTLKPPHSRQSLRHTACQMTDNQAAEQLNHARSALFSSLNLRHPLAA